MSSSSENLPKMTSEVLIQKEIKCILGCTVWKMLLLSCKRN
jgi:hypothetical protein